MKATYSIEEWNESRPRWHEFVTCLELVAPEQAPFVFEKDSRMHQAYLLVALQSNEVVGFIRFVVQPIGPEAKCPALYLNGAHFRVRWGVLT